MTHKLNGFIFEIHNAPGNYVSELNIREDNQKFIVFNCNGIIDEIYISDMEKQFVEMLYSCKVDKLKKQYISSLDITPPILFNWKIEISFDDNKVISSGNTIPEEMNEFISYLRQIGVSIPLKKNKK